jgi:hypothetical protein
MRSNGRYETPLVWRAIELLAQCAEMNWWHVVELNLQVAHAVQLVKGGTSRTTRSEFPELGDLMRSGSLLVRNCLSVYAKQMYDTTYALAPT